MFMMTSIQYDFQDGCRFFLFTLRHTVSFPSVNHEYPLGVSVSPVSIAGIFLTLAFSVLSILSLVFAFTDMCASTQRFVLWRYRSYIYNVVRQLLEYRVKTGVSKGESAVTLLLLVDRSKL